MSRKLLRKRASISPHSGMPVLRFELAYDADFDTVTDILAFQLSRNYRGKPIDTLPSSRGAVIMTVQQHLQEFGVHGAIADDMVNSTTLHDIRLRVCQLFPELFGYDRPPLTEPDDYDEKQRMHIHVPLQTRTRQDHREKQIDFTPDFDVPTKPRGFNGRRNTGGSRDNVPHSGRSGTDDPETIHVGRDD